MSCDWKERVGRKKQKCKVCERCLMAVTIVTASCAAAVWAWPQIWASLPLLAALWIGLFVAWIAIAPSQHTNDLD
jgi:fatty acid desaturase